MKHINSIFFLFLFISCVEDLSDIGEGSSVIRGDKKVYALAFSTTNPTDSFYRSIQADYGRGFFDSAYFTFHVFEDDWCDDTVLLRFEKTENITLDNSAFTEVFCTAETKKGKDLLLPGSDSQKEIRKYIHKKYQLTVKK